MAKPVLFGKFCLLERISVGGMAEVFRAKPLDAPNFDKFLAIKRILPNLAEDEEFISMFIDEAKIAVQLQHRNICQIYELGRLHDSHYIVMEFISGRDILAIQNRMRRERKIMSVGQAIYLTRQIAAGLDSAHKKTGPDGKPLNIIHRDISPQNILVSYTGEVKVIDFGIAKAATRSNKTQVGVLKGKFGYMSPEQVRGFPLDRRSDIFALGTLLHEMLTCRRLFYGESDFATLEKVRKVDIHPPSKHNPNVPPEIDRIVMRALAAEPDQRYQWCSELMDDIDNFLAKLRPPYTERTLEDWMQRTFAEELEGERHKRQEFALFQTEEDVVEHNEKLRQELVEKMGLSPDFDGVDKDQINEQSTMIWDSAAGLPGADLAPTEEATVQDAPKTMIVDGAGGLLQPPQSQPVAYVPPSMAHLYGDQMPQTHGSQSGGMGKIGVLLVAALVFFSLAILGGAVYVFFGTDALDSAIATTGSVSVKTTPVQDVEVLLNGDLIATRTPFTKADLSPGAYTVELKHPDYKPTVRRVTVAAGETQDVSVELEARPVGKGTITLTVRPPRAVVYVDGEPLKAVNTGKRTITLDDRREHLIEARLVGHYVAETRIELTDGQKVTKTLELRKIRGEIDLKSKPGGKVFLNGAAVGRTPTVLKDLDPFRVHELQVRAPGHQVWSKKVLFHRSYKKAYSARLKRGTGTIADETRFGALSIDSGLAWWRVHVNGWDTGMTTPVTEKQPLTLPVGSHTISFVRGNDTHNFQVEVKAGTTGKLDKDTPFRW